MGIRNGLMHYNYRFMGFYPEGDLEGPFVFRDDFYEEAEQGCSYKIRDGGVRKEFSYLTTNLALIALNNLFVDKSSYPERAFCLAAKELISCPCEEAMRASSGPVYEKVVRLLGENCQAPIPKLEEPEERFRTEIRKRIINLLRASSWNGFHAACDYVKQTFEGQPFVTVSGTAWKVSTAEFCLLWDVKGNFVDGIAFYALQLKKAWLNGDRPWQFNTRRKNPEKFQYLEEEKPAREATDSEVLRAIEGSMIAEIEALEASEKKKKEEECTIL